MKNVLFISYFYPPIGGCGPIRTLKFNKYLSEYGWQPIVLTVRNRDRFYTQRGYDIIPDGIQVYRSLNVLNNLSVIDGIFKRLNITKQFMVPDIYIGWIPMAILNSLRIIKNNKIDIIYTSAESDMLVALVLKRITGIPFVVDFRDAWTLNPYKGKYLLPSLKWLDESFEGSVLSSADHILTTTEGTKEDYIQKYPYVESKISCMFSGFDVDDIPISIDKFDKFTIIYTGFFYGVQMPNNLFSALKKIINDKYIPEEKIQFLWVGPNNSVIHNLIKEYGISDIVNYMGLKSKGEADALIYKSHLLYYLLGYTEKVSQFHVIPAKIFPYLASGISLLAETSVGDSERMIREYSDNSYIITDGDDIKIMNSIIKAYKEWELGKVNYKLSEKTLKFRNDFDFRNITGDLSKIFDDIIKKY